MSTALEASPFLLACRCQPAGRTPLWIMRQAGRYLPEYRALREKHEFMEICRTPALAAEATLQPIQRYGLDAAIVFSDILVVAQAMGVEVEFRPGPVFRTSVDGPEAVRQLHTAGVREATEFVPLAVREARQRLAGRTPLIGFAGAPFTVATYLVEGGGSRNFERVKSLLFRDPGCAEELLAKVAAATAEYLGAQIEAGADAVMLFDTHAGLLGPEEFERFAARPVEAVLARLRPGVPRIYYSQGTAGSLRRIGRLPVQVVGLDFRVDLGLARDVLGPELAVQGNLDPAALLGPPEEVGRRARAILAANGGRPGHIMNLGHGILPTTSPEVVQALVDTVREWRDSA
ncbi:MAG TPA: uroporphyrinogen decarboxylase [Candidatus Saccharimonadales bacterium]|nr:uroporphyrinogen decarboxylase [Candidatus Saccharimonadales bacterium]